MATSILEYLAGLRRHGHTPQQIGFAEIGKTTYAVGSFIQADDHRVRLALLPCYSRNGSLKYGDLPVLPAAYRRSSKTVFDCGDFFGVCYVSGWSEKGGVFWLDAAPEFVVAEATRTMACNLKFEDSFESCLSRAADEVLLRIEAAEREAAQ